MKNITQSEEEMWRSVVMSIKSQTTAAKKRFGPGYNPAPADDVFRCRRCRSGVAPRFMTFRRSCGRRCRSGVVPRFMTFRRSYGRRCRSGVLPRFMTFRGV
jgi:hypothetical protein